MKVETSTFEEKFKSIIDLIGNNIKEDRTSKKPLVPHLLRVGRYLYENNYSDEIVAAGLLHDLIEWTDNPESLIKDTFGQHVYEIVLANTKNRHITDPVKRREDYVRRCALVGIDALIVKAADALDSFDYYTEQGDFKEIERSKNIARLILENVTVNDDPIFLKLHKIVQL